MDSIRNATSNTLPARLRKLPDTSHNVLSKAERICRHVAPALLLLIFGAIACEAQALQGITTVTSNFLTWFRAFLGIVAVIAIVWGGARIMFSGDVGRGLTGIFSGIVGLFIAGYAQQIVSLFYSVNN
jgi:type IV secretory pathway VirB2 component (pilin)